MPLPTKGLHVSPEQGGQVVAGGGHGNRLCAMQWIARETGANLSQGPSPSAPSVPDHLARLIITCNDRMCQNVHRLHTAPPALCSACATSIIAVARRTVGTKNDAVRVEHYARWVIEMITDTAWGIAAYDPSAPSRLAHLLQAARQAGADGALSPLGLSFVWNEFGGKSLHYVVALVSGDFIDVVMRRREGSEAAKAVGKAIDAWRAIIGQDTPAEASERKPTARTAVLSNANLDALIRSLAPKPNAASAAVPPSIADGVEVPEDERELVPA